MVEKNYIKWSAKAFKTQYWEIINLSLNLAQLNALNNNNWYIRLSVLKKKETDQWGNTHYIVENTYDWNNWWQSNNSRQTSSNDDFVEQEDNELPF